MVSYKLTLVIQALIIALVAANNRTGLLMPNERITMRKIHEILRLHWDCKLSHRQIAKSCSVSRGTVSDYIYRANAAGLSLQMLSELDEQRLEEMLFSDKLGRPGDARPLPNFEIWHDKLKRKGMTLALLWEQYKQDAPDGFNYSHICDQYRIWEKKIDLVMRQSHRAGEKLFSDFAGSKLLVTNPHTGEVLEAHLFVAALGASSYTYAEAFPSEDSQSWCLGHANAFLHFGGTSELIIPDNPRAAVTKPSPYEPDLHPDFQHMAEFFGVGVIPARVRKPKDKAIAEAAVRVATMWIIAALRDQTFFSFAELNSRVDELLQKLNNRPFKKIPGTRKILFNSIDKPALKPLPAGRYEYTEIGSDRVGRDYHINIDGYRYSVPYEYVSEKVEYRMTAATVEVFFRGKRIASHPRLWIKDKPSTLNDHLPENHRQYLEQHVEWTPEKLFDWANKIGNAVEQVVQKVMSKNQHAEQKFRSCLGILRLARTWGNERLNAASQRALDLNACSYKHIKLILENGGDCRAISSVGKLQIASSHENIRGAEYYNQPNKETDNATTTNNPQLATSQTLGNDPGAGNSTANG